MIKSKFSIQFITITLLFALTLSILVIVCMWSYYFIHTYSAKYCYSNLQQLPHEKVGIVLGTSKYVARGKHNEHYKRRIQATIELFRAQKIDYIIVSGDNSTSDYDEATTMRNDLLEAGIPFKNIYRDFAGFRTFDSMIRAQKVFGVQSCIVISQDFHTERAVFIARHFGIQAIGFSASDAPSGTFVLFREYLARLAALLDIFSLGTTPKFLGEPIHIGQTPPT